MKAFLIRFTYDGWCQGPVKRVTFNLVYAKNKQEAVKLLQEKYDNAGDFFDCTVGI
jgi:hypothetical protein